jgi:SAM-dependent methyltransferase
LKCKCGNTYPVIDGVPRFLENGLGNFPEFVERYEAQIKTKAALKELPRPLPKENKTDDYDYIRRSFSKEWKVFDYSNDKTWGWSLEERKKVFLQDVALTESQLKGRVLLDAGCGNGTLTAALSTFGMKVVGMDLHDGLGLANRNRARSAGEYWRNVHFAQGNLFTPCLKRDSFDVVYSSGVIHHTPDSRETFKKLVPLVKRKGRLYVWVYGPRACPVRLFMGSGRLLKKCVSPDALLTTCRMMAPFYGFGTELLNRMGLVPFRKRSAREVTLDLFDAFAPQYNHRHTEDEVKGWFTEQGFTNITVSGKQKHGFGVFGDRI